MIELNTQEEENGEEEENEWSCSCMYEEEEEEKKRGVEILLRNAFSLSIPVADQLKKKLFIRRVATPPSSFYGVLLSPPSFYGVLYSSLYK